LWVVGCGLWVGKAVVELISKIEEKNG